jgi:hypothetical protein
LSDVEVCCCARVSSRALCLIAAEIHTRQPQ